MRVSVLSPTLWISGFVGGCWNNNDSPVKRQERNILREISVVADTGERVLQDKGTKGSVVGETKTRLVTGKKILDEGSEENKVDGDFTTTREVQDWKPV